MPARRLDEATPDQHQRDSAAQEEHSTGGGHRDSMAMTERDQSRKRWTHFATIGLGLWLASSPLIFGIADADSVASRVATVTAERGLASIEWRAMALAWRDVASGLLLALFGILSQIGRAACRERVG